MHHSAWHMLAQVYNCICQMKTRNKQMKETSAVSATGCSSKFNRVSLCHSHLSAVVGSRQPVFYNVQPNKPGYKTPKHVFHDMASGHKEIDSAGDQVKKLQCVPIRKEMLSRKTSTLHFIINLRLARVSLTVHNFHFHADFRIKLLSHKRIPLTSLRNKSKAGRDISRHTFLEDSFCNRY